MTRHRGFDVRVAPHVLESIDHAQDPRQPAAFFDAVDRLARHGTRAPGAKKLKALDLWEIRFRDSRAFFTVVPGKRVIAVGAVTSKKSRRLRMSRLRTIEHQVQRWRRQLENEG
jgi:hypothetical protein